MALEGRGARLGGVAFGHVDVAARLAQIRGARTGSLVQLGWGACGTRRPATHRAVGLLEQPPGLLQRPGGAAPPGGAPLLLAAHRVGRRFPPGLGLRATPRPPPLAAAVAAAGGHSFFLATSAALRAGGYPFDDHGFRDGGPEPAVHSFHSGSASSRSSAFGSIHEMNGAAPPPLARWAGRARPPHRRRDCWRECWGRPGLGLEGLGGDERSRERQEGSRGTSRTVNQPHHCGPAGVWDLAKTLSLTQLPAGS